MLVTIVAALALSPQRHHAMQHRHAKPINEEPAIRAGFNDVMRAFETKNWALFRSRCAPNFKQESPNHQIMNLRQCVATMQRSMAPLTDIKASTILQRIDVNGKMAKADDRYLLKAKFKDKKGSHTMRLEGSETVSLKKIGGRWVAYYVKTHDESVAVDGRIVSHQP